MKNTEKHNYKLTPFEYHNSYSSAKEFQEWWEMHYTSSIVSEAMLLTQISSGFGTTLFEKVKAKISKGEFLFIKETIALIVSCQHVLTFYFTFVFRNQVKNCFYFYQQANIF
jgi:hypothetical protein